MILDYDGDGDSDNVLRGHPSTMSQMVTYESLGPGVVSPSSKR